MEANYIASNESRPSSLQSPPSTAGALVSSLIFVNPTVPVPPAAPDIVSPPPRSSRRWTIGQFSVRYTPESFCTSSNDPSHLVQEETLAYHDVLKTDYATGDYNGSDPRAYALIEPYSPGQWPCLFSLLWMHPFTPSLNMCNFLWQTIIAVLKKRRINSVSRNLQLQSW